MRKPYFKTIERYTMTPGDGCLRQDDHVILQSNGDYVRVTFADPSLCRHTRIIEIPIEELLRGAV